MSKVNQIMTLREWITSVGGPQKASKLLKVSESAISFWLSCKKLPSSENLVKIVEVSKGRVSYADIIETFVRNQPRPRI